MMNSSLIFLLIIVFIKICFGLNNGLGLVPQMGIKKIEILYSRKQICISIAGWNSWNRFHCNIDEQLFKRTADAIVSTGLAKAGYTYGLFIVHH